MQILRQLKNTKRYQALGISDKWKLNRIRESKMDYLLISWDINVKIKANANQ